MRYLFDTNALIALLNDPAGLIGQRVRQYQPEDFGLSAIVAFELYFGAHNSRRKAENLKRLDGLYFELVPFDLEDAQHAGEIRAALAASGTPIGSWDVQIAGQARARGLTLISHNLREFERVPGLRVESWLA